MLNMKTLQHKNPTFRTSGPLVPLLSFPPKQHPLREPLLANSFCIGTFFSTLRYWFLNGTFSIKAYFTNAVTKNVG